MKHIFMLFKSSKNYFTIATFYPRSTVLSLRLFVRLLAICRCNIFWFPLTYFNFIFISTLLLLLLPVFLGLLLFTTQCAGAQHIFASVEKRLPGI